MSQPGQPASPSDIGVSSRTKTYPFRFGEVGIMIKVLTRDQVKIALKQQHEINKGDQKKRLGEVLVGLGWISAREIETILVSQARFREKQAKELGQAGEHEGEDAIQASPAARSTKKNLQKLGAFELIRKLGEGSMGQVYQARDAENDQIVALKILPKSLATDAEFLERFRREIKTVGKLNHPNIVSYLGSGGAGGYRYLAMEFVDGESLFARLKRVGKFEEKEGLRIACEIAKALEHAHEASLIHRDIKPENVLLTKDLSVKVTDFGLAKSQEDTSKLTAVGLSVGTPHYLSPEQAMGSQEVDHRADMYSLGATLFHLVTGRVPFDHPSSTKVMVMHVKDPPPDPRSLAPSLSRDTSKLILKLMSKAPGDRFAKTSELVQSIESLIEGKPLAPLSGGAANKTGGRLSPVAKAPFRLAKGCLARTGIFLAIIAALSYICAF